jgi:RNA polymerase-binding transcription factor DksA
MFYIPIRLEKAALLRIAAGEYGICTDCQASIDAGRLGAYPTAKRCYRCHVSYEHNHAKDSGPSM